MPDGAPSKKVDEDWKRRVADEKKAAEAKQPPESASRPARPSRPKGAPGEAAPPPAGAPEAAPPPGKPEGRADPRFLQFLQGVAAQALMALGQIEGLPEPDLRQAKMVIDTLVMLEEKTRGNRTPDEDQAIRALVQELQSVYVQMAM
jgi:hypothetical protein